MRFSAYLFESATDAAAGPEFGELAGWASPGIHAQEDKLTWCWWNPFDMEGFWVGNEWMFVGNNK